MTMSFKNAWRRAQNIGRLKTIYIFNLLNILSLTVAQIAVVPLFLHYLGVKGYEEWVFISAIGFAGQIIDLGMIVHNSNSVRIAYGQQDHSTAQRTIGEGLAFFIVLFVTLTLVAGGIGLLDHTATAAALALIVLHIPFAQFRTWLSYIFTARISQIGELSFFIGLTLLQTLLFVATVMLGGGITALALVQLLSTLLLGIVPLIFGLRYFAPDIVLHPRPVARRDLTALAKGCLSNFGYSATGIAVTHFPVILLGLIPNLPIGSLATFTTSRTLTGIVRQFCQQLARSNAIEISRHLAPGQEAHKHRLFLIGAVTIPVMAAIGMGGLWPVADVIMKIWTGKPDLYDPLVIGLFCIFAVFSAQFQLPMLLPQFTNCAAIMIKPLAAQVILIILLGLPAGALFGAAGMVIALAIAELSTLGIISLRRIIPETGIPSLRFLKLTGTASLAAFALSVVASLISKITFDPQGIRGLLESGAVWLLVMTPASLFFYKMARRFQWS